MENRSFYCYFCIVLCLLCLNTSFAATIYVPIDQPTIQSGIDGAKDGDMVIVTDGTYKGEGNVNIDFLGKEITVKSANGPSSTIVDCMWTPETRGFIFHNEETNRSILEGFTIKNGNHELGGGIHFYYASPTLKNCVITDNRVPERPTLVKGSCGIYVFNSDAIILDCMVSNMSGGGIAIVGQLDVDENLLRESRAEPIIINSQIIENEGNGISAFDFVNPTIRDCIVSQNTGIGIVYSYDAMSNIPVTNCIITHNTGGGVAVREFSILEITKSVIKNNTAKDGGGIYCSSTSKIIASDCIIAENFAQRYGGGITVISTYWKSEISNCTITRNTANDRGGGVYAFIEISSFDFTDSIVWGNNSEGTYNEFYANGGFITLKSNDIRDGLKGIGLEDKKGRFIYEDNIDEDPLFVDANRGDYRLKFNSPAIDMGANVAQQGALSVSSAGKRLVKWGDLKRR